MIPPQASSLKPQASSLKPQASSLSIFIILILCILVMEISCSGGTRHIEVINANDAKFQIDQRANFKKVDKKSTNPDKDKYQFGIIDIDNLGLVEAVKLEKINIFGFEEEVSTFSDFEFAGVKFKIPSDWEEQTMDNPFQWAANYEEAQEENPAKIIFSLNVIPLDPLPEGLILDWKLSYLENLTKNQKSWLQNRKIKWSDKESPYTKKDKYRSGTSDGSYQFGKNKIETQTNYFLLINMINKNKTKYASVLLVIKVPEDRNLAKSDLEKTKASILELLKLYTHFG